MTILRLHFQSLRFQVLALLVTTFTIIFVIAVYNAYERRNHELSEMLKTLGIHAHEIADSENQTVRYIEQLPLLISQTSVFNPPFDSSNCHLILEHLVKNDPHIANLMLAAPNGNVVCKSNTVPGSLNVADRHYFKEALASRDLIVGEAIMGRTSKLWVLPFAISVRDKQGHIKGVMEASLDLGWIKAEFVRGKYPPEARIGLIDSEGNVLARYPDPESLTGKNISHIPFFKALMEEHGNGSATVPDYDNVQRIFVFSPFSRTGVNEIYLWIGMSRASVLANADAQFTRSMLLLSAISLLTFSLVWFGGSRLLVHPINVIAATADRLSKGDYHARTSLPYAANELGNLAKTVDNMAGALASRSALLRLNRSLSVLISCNRVLVHANSEQQLLNDICQIIIEHGGFRMAWVGIVNHDDTKSITPIIIHGFEDGYLAHANITWADTPHGQGVTGIAVRSGIPHVNHDFERDPTAAPWREAASRRGYRTSSAFPLMKENRAWGVLTVYSEKLDAFTEKEVALLTDLAADITFGIDSLKTKSELVETRLDIIRRLTNAGEYRDNDTGAHIKRMSMYCEAIGRAMNLSDTQCELLLAASPMHDVGKIGIPDHILLKPGKLTAEEFEIIKTHTTIGADILNSPTSELLSAARDIALYHHEKWDGSGYPRGIGGNEIPLMARIVAVADVYDALTTTRPYKKPWPAKEALAEITRLSGSHFDPTVVKAFIACYDDILRIKAANSN